MPKIIENAKEKILEVTKKELSKKSYDELSIREIAKLCNLGVGTIYNYYPDKLSLVASLMATEWASSVSLLYKDLANASSLYEGLEEIYSVIFRFWSKNKAFLESAQVKNFSKYQKRGHALILEQIKEMIKFNYDHFKNSIEDIELTLLSHLLLDCALNDSFTINDLITIIKNYK
jgi:AcrR family transcriptional regulator